MKKYLKLIRVKHWLKNGLVFLPLFFSLGIKDISLLTRCILAFFIFSATSSIIYIYNDMNDIEKDKNHPTKKLRPLASGDVSIRQASIIMVLLAMIDIILMSILYINISNIFVFIVPVIYIVLNVLYSKILKDIPILDVTIIVIGFILRILYGSISTSIEVSKYLYLMIIFGSFFLGFGKRRNEIVKNGNKSRPVLEKYNKDFLDKNMYVSYALSIVAYTLWTVDPVTIARIGNDYIFWTIPLLMIILQLYSLNIEDNSDGDPTEVIFSDKKLLFAGTIYIIALIIILYIL